MENRFYFYFKSGFTRDWFYFEYLFHNNVLFSSLATVGFFELGNHILNSKSALFRLQPLMKALVPALAVLPVYIRSYTSVNGN
jgi:hypothetical protein